MEMELRCSGAVDCLLALSFGFGEKCFVCKSLKLHIMASLAVSSSWPQTEPTDMHRATGQMGKRATGQPGSRAAWQLGKWATWSTQSLAGDEDLKWPMENGETGGKQLAENWPRQIVNSLGQCFREVWQLQSMSQLGAQKKKNGVRGNQKPSQNSTDTSLGNAMNIFCQKKNKKVKSCLRG